MKQKEKVPCLVSIIIPVYNIEKYLKQCIESVVRQSYYNLEILIIDDGSTDESGFICDDYSLKDKRISVYHTNNRGLSAARNFGLDKANGEFVSFIDSDDWFEPDAIENMIKKALETGADIVCCRYIQEYNRNWIEKEDDLGKEKVFTGDEAIKEYCIGSSISSVVWNKLYRKTIFDGIRFPERRYYEEYATTYKIILKCKTIACIPKVLVHYRMRKGSINNSHDLIHLKDQWWACTKCFEDLASISREYGTYQLKMCIVTILRLWTWFPGFKKEEKKKAKLLLDETFRFIADNKSDIKCNSDIPIVFKVLCVSPICVRPFLMKILYLSNLIFKQLRCKRLYT